MNALENTAVSSNIGMGHTARAIERGVQESELALIAFFIALLFLRVFGPREHRFCQVANAARIGLQ